MLDLIVEFVTGIVFGSSGEATGKGVDENDVEATVGYQFGFYSRPKDKNAEGFVVKAGGKGGTAILFSWRDRQYELTLQAGEVGIANAFNATVKLDVGGNVVLNGGVLKVARVGDGTTGHVHVVNGMAGPFPVAGVAVIMTDTIAQGAPKVLA